MAFSLIFQIPFHKNFDCEAAFANYKQTFGVKHVDKYVMWALKGVCDNLRFIDERITSGSSNWDIDRICRADLAILRQSAFELLYQNDIPVGITINEAVEIAKTFGTDGSASFVNGVLSAVAKTKWTFTQSNKQ